MSDDPKTNGNRVTACHDCGAPIVISGKGSGPNGELPFVRVRCNQLRCGFVDWYSQGEFALTDLPSPSLSPKDAGGVWLHDFLLGESVPERQE